MDSDNQDKEPFIPTPAHGWSGDGHARGAVDLLWSMLHGLPEKTDHAPGKRAKPQKRD